MQTVKLNNARLCHRISVIILAVILITACALASTSTPLSPTVGAPTIASGTSTAPTAVPPTLTAPPVTPTTSAPPTMAPTVVPPTVIFPEGSDSMQIKITVEDTELTAALIDSQTPRDFTALLPLTLTLEDYGSTEKISYLPARLSTADAPSGIDPSVGDLTYYAPWGNLAIFIRDFGYSSGLVLLGKIDGDIEALNVSGPVSVTIELVK